MVSARSEDKETSGQLHQCFAQKGGCENGLAPLAVFIADCALGRMWLDFGINPQYVHGLGIGEYAAAALAGIWSLEDALDLMIGLAGIMKKKNLSMESGNSPENSWTRCFEAMRPEAGILFEKMNYSKPVLKFAPTYVNPEKADAALSPDYWLSHKASSVSLADNVRYLQNNKCNIFLEAGLGCGMAQTIKRMLPDENVLLLETVNPEGENIVNALGWLYLAGYKIHWEKVYWGFDGETVSLPHYAFDMKSYFLGKP